MANIVKKRYCEKCGRTYPESSFYTSNNLEKYKDGFLNVCKLCASMHIDNWDPETYTWILRECDVPYIPDEWNKLLISYKNNPDAVKTNTILGRYLSKMKLSQYKKYRWSDTEFLQSIKEKEMRESMEKQGYSESSIAAALAEARIVQPERPQNPEPATGPQPQFYNAEDELTAELTEEDRKMLSLKWGASYKPIEWIALEKLYNDMMESYDIQSAGHVDTLKKCCRTSLKADQLLEINDVEGAQKMIRMYDMLMKSGRFTAAQNKKEQGEAVDSLSELIAMCETDGFIPRYYTDSPQDKVDRVLQDMQNYVRTLVTEELGLGDMIESAVKQIEQDKEKEAELAADAADEDELFEESLFSDEDDHITVDDMNEFSDLLEEQQKENAEVQEQLTKPDAPSLDVQAQQLRERFLRRFEKKGGKKNGS